MNIHITNRSICDLLKEIAQDDTKKALLVKLTSGDSITVYGPIEIADRFMLCRSQERNHTCTQLIALDTIEFIR
ncbi:MAG TPA: hypothetical protein VLA00_10390 [Xanthobacteraceae bacterium]|nr:hypothetical protein [Xanthobacteraceae bacterium]